VPAAGSGEPDQRSAWPSLVSAATLPAVQVPLNVSATLCVPSVSWFWLLPYMPPN
jgi:hypothetical protein